MADKRKPNGVLVFACAAGSVTLIVAAALLYKTLSHDGWEAFHTMEWLKRIEDADKLKAADPVAAYRIYEAVLCEAAKHTLVDSQFKARLAEAADAKDALAPIVQEATKKEQAEERRRAEENVRLTAQLEAAEKRETMIRERAIAYRSVSPAIRAAINPLKRIEARTEVGINLIQYTEELGRAWAETKIFVESPEARSVIEFADMLEHAAAEYKAAVDPWREKIDASSEGLKAAYDDLVQNRWKQATWWIKLADGVLDPAACEEILRLYYEMRHDSEDTAGTNQGGTSPQLQQSVGVANSNGQPRNNGARPRASTSPLSPTASPDKQQATSTGADSSVKGAQSPDATPPARPAPAKQRLTPAFTFGSPVPLTAGGMPINVGSHAAPRLADWNDDGALDLLVAGGDGRVWLFRQGKPENDTDFLRGERLMADGTEIRVGTAATGVCFSDINGDGKPDLIASGNDRRLRYYANIGTSFQPAFKGFEFIRGTVGELMLADGVGGRIDIADWDVDGLVDLFTGAFDGYITLYRNKGTPSSPVFDASGTRLSIRGTAFHEAYNVHPRVFDVNQDGTLDVAYGINWGYIKVLVNTKGAGSSDFTTQIALQDAAGKQLDIRKQIGDDTIPDFADLTGDGVLDLISGGLNGKLFIMRGVNR